MEWYKCQGKIIMKNYISLIKDILTDGEDHDSRAGMCRTLTHQKLTFDLREGFPRLTNRYVPFKSVAVELEGFIGGITSKKWYQDRGCKFWDEWANPVEVSKLHEKIDNHRYDDDLSLIHI